MRKQTKIELGILMVLIGILAVLLIVKGETLLHFFHSFGRFGFPVLLWLYYVMIVCLIIRISLLIKKQILWLSYMLWFIPFILPIVYIFSYILYGFL